MTSEFRRRGRIVPVVLVVVIVCAAGIAAGLSFAASSSPVLTTIGGTGAGQGTTVAQNPVSLATTPSGGLEIGDGTLMVVRDLTASGGEANAACSGNIATRGFGGDGGPAADASCDGPYGLAVDRDGNLYIADNQNNRIRVVATTTETLLGTAVTAGQITTVAGDGTWGYAGNAGAATSAQLAYPAGIALDGSGNLVICDSGNNVVRVVAATTGSFYGQSMTAGDIYTVAGGGTAGDAGNGTSAVGAELDQPTGVAVDTHGNLVIADLGNNEVRVVAAASGTFYQRSMTAGDIYTVAGDGKAGYAGDHAAAAGAELDQPESVAVDAHGNVVVADYGNNRVRLVAEESGTSYGLTVAAGDIYTVAGTGNAEFSGDGGPAAGAALSSPRGVVVDGQRQHRRGGLGEQPGPGDRRLPGHRLRPVRLCRRHRNSGRHRSTGWILRRRRSGRRRRVQPAHRSCRRTQRETWPSPTRTTIGSGSYQCIRVRTSVRP